MPGINRVEQLYPFPDHDIQSLLKKYSHVKEVIWCQEEPRNMGAWTFAAPRIKSLLQSKQELIYAGRQASASPAAGQMKIHQVEQERLVKNAIG
jgi:multifunctional 2-oxoglutarate metabolism enzyme